ncbi:ABC-F family ATP-binding cassette domain-containing protein [Brevibacillus halotolerans]|uniref:ABC-F family ATP-binding cassette domain-containing protein n=1 Tax=Brevibacillus laterosporus TaxID=1465 RepID=UPI00215C9A5A|nr:ABC-F family ATP-binding cassette domain-containing protein [Brevibacillus laterosporus]MCR8997250.1 ATP-binding cassette domain-containing protein [Brevibacillus laterosporus]WPS88463.1 ABC-F family ATP-binding cassette domain-containing protein [Brevibacillus halotolerans]
MSILAVENVTQMYGDNIIFQNISFRLLQGEHAGLVGSNGAGKSTLLRILAGELLPDSGTVKWLSHLKIGYLQQHIHLQAGTTILQYLQGAFAHLYEIEKKLLQVTEEMATPKDNLERLLARYGELQSILDHSDFYQIETKIEEIASGLGIYELGMDRDVETLSGGQRTKLLLGKLLLEEPHVLLLDEPTNYLDDAHIAWLINYVKSYKHAFLVVSHDQRFLNEITTAIYHLEHQTIKQYTGNYDFFLTSYAQNKQQLHNAYERQQKEISRLENFIEKNRVRKAKQAKSREKALEKIARMEKPTSSMQPRFMFYIHSEPVSRILEARNLQIGYTEPLLGPIDLRVTRGEKIAIVGYNGIGKSTMLRTLLGYLQPLRGSVRIGERVKPAYFSQEGSASNQTPLEQVWSLRPDLTQKEIRQALARSGLSEQHIRQKVCLLSGGEQAKVRLCELMLTNSNVLVLDEPTNHLDTGAKEAFKEALKQYEGTILLVSHEPAFYEDWVTQIWRVQNWS